MSHLARILQQSSNSVSLPHVLHYAKKNTDGFAILDELRVKRELNKADQILNDNRALINKVLKQRSLYYSQLSKEHMKDGYDSVFKEYPASHTELYRLIRDLGKAINIIEVALRNLTHIWRQDNESDIKQLLVSLWV